MPAFPSIFLLVPSDWGEKLGSSGMLWPHADQEPGPGAPGWPHPLFWAWHRKCPEHLDSFWEQRFLSGCLRDIRWLVSCQK